MSNNKQADLIIVGAGPAGLSTALHLARLAPDLIPRTILLEKARHPRHKLCGGGLLPDAEFILRNLDLDISAIPSTLVDKAHFEYQGKGFALRVEKDGAYAFRTVRRDQFDAWLAGEVRRRGFRIDEETAVKGISVTPSGVSLATNRGEYRARAVVGADGSSSLVRRFILPREPVHVARLLEITTPPTGESSSHLPADAYFDFKFVPRGLLGYTWDFPAVEKGAPVRLIGVYDSNVHPVEASLSLRSGLAEEFHAHGLELADYALEGAPLRWFEPRSAFSAPCLLLVGDAAGVDALLGEGISLALGYGALAASALRDAFEREDFSFSSYRSSVLHSEMGKALRRRTWWARIEYWLRSAPIQALVWRRLGLPVAWIARNFLLGWARRQADKTAR